MATSFSGQIIGDLPKPMINKSLTELIPLIEVGQTVYAHTGKQGTMSIRKEEQGQYIYQFEWLDLDMGWISDEGEAFTTFIENLNVGGETTKEGREIAIEMKEALTQSIWSTEDEASYNMGQYDSEKRRKLAIVKPQLEAPTAGTDTAKIRDVHTLCYTACMSLANEHTRHLIPQLADYLTIMLLHINEIDTDDSDFNEDKSIYCTIGELHSVVDNLLLSLMLRQFEPDSDRPNLSFSDLEVTEF